MYSLLLKLIRFVIKIYTAKKKKRVLCADMGKGFDIRSFTFDPQHSHFLTVWAWQVKEFFQVTVSSSVKLEVVVVGAGGGVLPFAFFWTHGPTADLFTNAFNLILSCSLNKVLVTIRVPQKQTWDKKSYEVTHQGTRRDLEGNEGDRAEREKKSSRDPPSGKDLASLDPTHEPWSLNYSYRSVPLKRLPDKIQDIWLNLSFRLTTNSFVVLNMSQTLHGTNSH